MKKMITLVFLGLLLIGCSANEVLENETQSINGTDARNPNKALVIKHGWDIPIMWRAYDKSLGADPEAFEKEINESPYDGVVLSAGYVSEHVFSSKPVNTARIYNNFSFVNESTFPNKHNFVRISVHNNYKIDKTKSPYEGKNLKNLLNNIKHFTIAAKNAGFKGIMLDNENINKVPGPKGFLITDPNKYIWRWSENDDHNICPGKTPEECEKILFEAGRKFMGTILNEWDDVKIMPLFGIWTGSEAYWDYAIEKTPHKYTWYNKNTLGHKFLLGMFSELTMRKKYWGTAHNAEYIDGGEIYGMKSSSTYADMANYLRYGITANSNPLFPFYLKKPYQDNMKTGFGVFEFRDELFDVPQYTPEQYAEAIRGSLYQSHYVWLYTEMHDWWKHDNNDWPKFNPDRGTKGPVTEEWKDAIKTVLSN